MWLETDTLPCVPGKMKNAEASQHSRGRFDQEEVLSQVKSILKVRSDCGTVASDSKAFDVHEAEGDLA